MGHLDDNKYPKVPFETAVQDLGKEWFMSFATHCTGGYDNNSVAYLGKVNSIANDPASTSKVIIHFDWIARKGMNQIFFRIGDEGYGRGVRSAYARATKPDHLFKKDLVNEKFIWQDLDLEFFVPLFVPRYLVTVEPGMFTDRFVWCFHELGDIFVWNGPVSYR